MFMGGGANLMGDNKGLFTDGELMGDLYGLLLWEKLSGGSVLGL